MARPTLGNHRKLKRLMYLLEQRRSHCMGYLACLWESSYESGEPRIGDALDVALAADWEGDPEEIATALEQAGFLDLEEDGSYWVHDLYDHAPEYVRLRRLRELERGSGVAAKVLRELVTAGAVDLSRPPDRATLRHLAGLSPPPVTTVEQRGTTCHTVATPTPAPTPQIPPPAPPVAGGGARRADRGARRRSRREREALGPDFGPPEPQLPPADVAAVVLERHLLQQRDRAPPASIRRLVAQAGASWPEHETPAALERLVEELREQAARGDPRANAAR